MIPMWTALLLAVIAGLAIAMDVILLVQKFKGNLSDTNAPEATGEPVSQRADEFERAA